MPDYNSETLLVEQDQSALATRGTKHAINKKILNNLNFALDVGLALEERSARHPDHTEEAKSFVEKRTPQYKWTI